MVCVKSDKLCKVGEDEMRILFIGGTGRLSKDVATLAVKRGNEVFLVTRGSESRKIFVSDEYHMIYGNIRDIHFRDELEKYEKFDVVIDFLSFTPQQIKTSLQIVDGLYKQYIFISTATVYKKKSEDEIISEYTTEIGNDKWDYAYQKYQCELYLKEYFYDKNERFYTVVRPYVTYGNTRIPYPIVPNPQEEWTFVQRILENKTIPVFDKGKTITTLTHTRDFAKGVVGLFMNEKAQNEAFHITNPETTTWGEVLDDLEVVLNKKIKREEFSQAEIYNTLPRYKSILIGDKGNMMQFDNSKICMAVPDFTCDISLKDGIQDMVSFYNANPSLKVIDYTWDGEIDRLCSLRGIREKVLATHSAKDEMRYYKGKYAFIGKMLKLLYK